ncbi:unnamed protein product [Lactuca saligna]|uniref:Uncharacterized protein n=1 Tax=Lactuca saligna TaxID=75948 RepID=A0AA35Y6C6_LACSI|nr:unnamed protein product [Lactuca saligna]
MLLAGMTKNTIADQLEIRILNVRSRAMVIDQTNIPREINAPITNLAPPSEVISPILTYASTPPLLISSFPTEELQDGDLFLREKNEILGTKCHCAKLQGSKKDKEIGKSPIVFPLSLHDNITEGEDVNTIADNDDQEEHKAQHEGNNSTLSSPLAPLMEVVHTIVSDDCVYFGVMEIKALKWMQNPQVIFAKQSNPVCSTAWLNDFSLIRQVRCKATPDVVFTLQEIVRVNLKPNLITYNHLIHGYYKEGKLVVLKRAMFDPFDTGKKMNNIRSYARRVFIMNDCNVLMQKYLGPLGGCCGFL